MAILDYADERAFNRFRRGFVGSLHGDNGSSYSLDWDSECGAQPTKMILTYGRPVCVYCGNKGLPLQPNIERFRDYEVTGYTCVCKGAMDEVEWQHELVELKKKHREEMGSIHQRKPETNPDVIKNLVQNLTAKLTSAKDMSEVNYILKQIKAISEEQ